MTFYDKGVKPYPFNGIKIQDFGNTPTSQNIARHHGINGSEQYATNKDAILCFACDYNDGSTISQRVVTFKAFIDSFKLNFNIERDESQSFTSPYIINYLSKFGFSYNISFDVPAHSVNEAISNMARFSELERILTYPYLSTSNAADANGYRFPLSYILFNNLINNGGFWERYGDSPPIDYTFNNIRKYGLRGVVKNINMTPDLELGVFEFNGQTYFKSFKVDFDIAVPNTPYHTSRTNEENNSLWQLQSIVSFAKMSYDGQKSYSFQTKDYLDAVMSTELALGAPQTTAGKNADSRGFPFNIPNSQWGKGFSYKTLNDYVNAAAPEYSKNKSIYFSICPNDGELTGEIAENTNVVKFLCFLESFKYTKEQKAEDFEPSSINITIPVFGDNVNDALRNASKLSYLFRMVTLGGDVKNKILLSNLIKSPSESGRNNSYSLNDTYGNGLAVNIQSIVLDVDLEMGFFEYNSFFIPKSFSLDFSTQVIGSDFGKIIVNDASGANKTFAGKGDSIRWPFGIRYDNPKENE